MFLFLTALSPRGLGQRWHGQEHPRGQGSPSPEHCRLLAAPPGSEPRYGVSPRAGSIRGTLCRVGTRRVGRGVARCGHSHPEGT